jgi:hypothetical protein
MCRQKNAERLQYETSKNQNGGDSLKNRVYEFLDKLDHYGFCAGWKIKKMNRKLLAGICAGLFVSLFGIAYLLYGLVRGYRTKKGV